MRIDERFQAAGGAASHSRRRRGHARRVGRSALAWVLIALGACSGGGAPSATDAEIEAAGRTCQDIRLCAWLCTSALDEPCVSRCISGSTAAAESAYRTLAACTASQCPNGDFYCGCEQQCQFDGKCQVETQICVAGPSDLMCDVNCH